MLATIHQFPLTVLLQCACDLLVYVHTKFVHFLTLNSNNFLLKYTTYFTSEGYAIVVLV